jgi:hypothetical protein
MRIILMLQQSYINTLIRSGYIYFLMHIRKGAESNLIHAYCIFWFVGVVETFLANRSSSQF